MTNQATWGPLEPRYDHQRPRRMLALDGGGIRGLITLEVLSALEKKLAAHYCRGSEFRLSQFFDYVAGTSTGAIIAAAIARGMSAQNILEFYVQYGAQIFTRRHWGVWNSLYQNGPLQQLLSQIYDKETTLEPGNLKTLLLVVMRNATTDSVWPVTSNPFAKYNEPSRKDCNLRVPLWQLVRASTAAPVYFPPEVISWDRDDPDKAFVCVDGGTTAYNNPAFLLARMATESRYSLDWTRGEDQLLIVSVGTGEHAVLGADAEDPTSNLLVAAQNTLQALMSQAAYDQDVNCRTVGRCSFGDRIDSEIEDLIPLRGGQPIPLSENLGRSFLYARYNASLTTGWLQTNGLGHLDEKAVRRLDAADAMDELREIGTKLGRQVDLAHLGVFTTQPLFVNGSYEAETEQARGI